MARKNLGSTDDKHEKQLSIRSGTAEDQIGRAKSALQAGHCKTAHEDLLHAKFNFGKGEAHRESIESSRIRLGWNRKREELEKKLTSVEELLSSKCVLRKTKR